MLWMNFQKYKKTLLWNNYTPKIKCYWKVLTFQTKLKLFNAPGLEDFMMILFKNGSWSCCT